jgi:hypothetical protein
MACVPTLQDGCRPKFDGLIGGSCKHQARLARGSGPAPNLEEHHETNAGEDTQTGSALIAARSGGATASHLVYIDVRVQRPRERHSSGSSTQADAVDSSIEPRGFSGEIPGGGRVRRAWHPPGPLLTIPLHPTQDVRLLGSELLLGEHAVVTQLC